MSSTRTTARHHHLKNIIRNAREDVTIYQLLSLSALYCTEAICNIINIRCQCILVRISHGSYTSSEITDMEMNILNILDWHICDVTAWSVSFTLIGLLSKTDNKKRILSVVDFTRLQVELSVSDYSTSVLCPSSSVVAFGAITNSLDLLDFTKKEKHAFLRVMYNYTNGKASNAVSYDRT